MGELNYHPFHMTLEKEMCNSDSINETLSYRRQSIGLSKPLHNTKPLSYLVADWNFKSMPRIKEFPRLPRRILHSQEYFRRWIPILIAKKKKKIWWILIRIHLILDIKSVKSIHKTIAYKCSFEGKPIQSSWFLKSTVHQQYDPTVEASFRLNNN